MRLYTIFILLSLIFIVPFSAAQTDSIDLQLAQLKAEDLILRSNDIGRQQVVSASRSLKALDELPFTIYVVTEEDIYKNGYVTLVDVLKSIPGIRVSQPGSALEGETFVMRGLFGNAYTKILVNDLPIKPSVVSGMPIGAQLPIRQAERIEIIFGPAAAVYGADASAGVINIILKETEKPIFTRTGLSAGVNGYSDLNVMFGGKIGKGKKILNFSFYGTNTVSNDLNTKYDLNNLYNPLLYVDGDSSFFKNPNYRGRPNLPDFGDLPHLSRNFGFNLRYRALQLSFSRMYRRDHSAIGLNPAAVSYSSPLNYIGENITRFNLGIRKNFKRFGFTTNLTVLNYALDVRSSYTYVNNTLWRFLDLFVVQEANLPSQRDSLQSQIYNDIFSRSRFSYASSTDVYLEQLFNFRPLSGLEIVAGGNLQLSYNLPIINYLTRARDASFFSSSNAIIGDSDEIPIPSFDAAFFNFGAFVQSYLSLKKLTVMAGLRYDYNSNYEDSFSPRLALQYRFGKRFSMRASYATAFRVPSYFYNANTLTLQRGDLNSLHTREDSIALVPETTFSYEWGTRWNWQNRIFADVSVFYSRTKNFISYNFNQDLLSPDPQTRTLTLGYFNDSKSEALVYGWQTRLIFKNIIPRYQVDTEINFSFTQGKEVLPFNKGEISRVRMQPKVLGQINLAFKPGRKIFVNLRNIFSSDWMRRFVVDSDNNFTTAGYYTLDVQGRFALNRNFQAFVHINNLLNKQYGGIGATGFVDDLFYNPQQTRNFKLGFTYSMN